MEKNFINETEFPDTFSPNLLRNDELSLETNQNYSNLHTKNKIKFFSSSLTFNNSPKINSYNAFNYKDTSIVSNSSEQPENFIKKKILKSKSKKKNRKNKIEKEKNQIDNLLRRAKKIIFDSILNYDNCFISEIYNNNIGNGLRVKKLLRINHYQIKNTNTNFNKGLLKTPQGEIFSVDISKRYTNFPYDHNRILIKGLLNEEDEEKKNSFKNLFGKTLFQCIQQLRCQKQIEGLEGLEKFYENEIIELNEKEEVKNELKKIINDYENIFEHKKPRKRKIK